MTKQNKKIFVSHMYLLFISLYSQTSVMLHDRLAWVYYPINLHYSQTNRRADTPLDNVLLPYKFTLLSNIPRCCVHHPMFYYPINLHYSQTLAMYCAEWQKFYYPINLHYSQTTSLLFHKITLFYYPINLHYSQTRLACCACDFLFYYHINLHYSQTDVERTRQ